MKKIFFYRGRDTRIAVCDVLGWLSKGMTYEEIVYDFPELTHQDIYACLAFAAKKYERNLEYCFVANRKPYQL